MTEEVAHYCPEDVCLEDEEETQQQAQQMSNLNVITDSTIITSITAVAPAATTSTTTIKVPRAKKEKAAATDGTTKPKAEKVGGGKSKPAKITSGVDELVLQYVISQNKPVSVQGVVDALQSKVPKTAVQTALEALAANNSLSIKDFKKARVYFPPQDSGANQAEAGGADGETAPTKPDLSSHITELRQRNEILEKDLKLRTAELHYLDSIPCDEELIEKHKSLQRIVADLSQQKSKLLSRRHEKKSSGGASCSGVEGGVVTAAEFEQKLKMISTYVREMKSRRLLALLVTEAVAGDSSLILSLSEELGLCHDKDFASLHAELAELSRSMPTKYRNSFMF